MAEPIDLEPEEIPTEGTMDYVVEAAPEVGGPGEHNVIFCVDTSGSSSCSAVNKPLRCSQRVGHSVRHHGGEGESLAAWRR